MSNPAGGNHEGLAHLEEKIRLSEDRIKHLEAVQKDKDLRISDLETALGEKEAYFGKILAGNGWKALTRYFKIRDALLPPASRRRRILTAVFKGPRAAARGAGRLAKAISKTIKPDRRFLNVQIDITNFCNLKCRMCYFRFQSVPMAARRQLTYDQVVKMIGPWASRIKSLGLSCGAEPLLADRRELLKILEFPEARGIPQSMLVTNATALDREIARKIVDSRIRMLQISFDSHVKETFEMIREGASYDRVVENIKYLRDYKKEKKSSFPYIQFVCILARWNIEQMSEYLDFIPLLGANGVDFRHLIVYQEAKLEDQSLVLDKALANRTLDLIREKCRTHGFHLNTIPENFALDPAGEPSASGGREKPRRGKRTCRIPQTFIYMGPSGDVLPCPYFYGEKPIGNLAVDDFETMWNRKEYADFRRDAARGRFTRKCCLTCPASGSGEVNDPRAFQAKDLEPQSKRD